jgi:transcriptional regulator with XRE-family HTH domain
MDNIIGKKLKKLLIENNMNQTDLARSICKSKGTIRDYVSGKIRPSHEALKDIADYFKITTDELLGRENKIAYNEGYLSDKNKKEILDIIEDIDKKIKSLKDLL